MRVALVLLGISRVAFAQPSTVGGPEAQRAAFVETDHSTGFAPLLGPVDTTNVLALIEAECGYVVHVDRMAVELMAIATDASGAWIGGSGQAASLRLALRAQL